MKHLIPSDELKNEIGFEDKENLHILACEFDSGEKATGNYEIIRLGGDGLEVFLFPCYSCYQQLLSRFTLELVDMKIGEAVKKETRKIQEKLTNLQIKYMSLENKSDDQ